MKLTPASSARWMMRMDSSWSWLPQSPNIMAPRQSGLTYMPVRPRVRWSIGETLLPGRRAAASASGGGDGGGEAADGGEREAGVGVALGDGVDRDLGVEADADDVVAAGGEVARDGELLGGGPGDAQLTVGAVRGAHRPGGGRDRRGVMAGGLVDDHHEPRRSGRLALGLEREPGREQHREHERWDREEAGHSYDGTTYDPVVQGPNARTFGLRPRIRRFGASGARWSGGSAHDELDRKRRSADRLPRHVRGEDVEGHRAQSMRVGDHGRERRRQHPRERQVVEPHHGHVLRDPPPPPARGEGHAARPGVALADD